MLINGDSVEQDCLEAYKWWLAAIMQGDTSAQTNMQLLTDKLTADERAAGEAAAVAWVNAFQAHQ
jgi:TPR repeat protein